MEAGQAAPYRMPAPWSFLNTKRTLLGHKKRPRWWPRKIVFLTAKPAAWKRL
jgi:hypothetical protein